MSLLSSSAKCDSHGNSVVSPQGGIPRPYKTILYIEIQRVFCEIMLRILCFLTYHIQMPLDDDRFTLLIAFCSGLFDDDIIQFS